jgi:DNA repair and recombination protein RAD52
LLTIPSPGDQHRDTAATINPFIEQKPHISEYSAREIATLQSRLDKQLGPEFVSTRPGAGGGKVHYLAAEKAINLANQVFGFNGWSSSIQNVQIDFVDENSANGKISLGLSTIVRVTIRDGTFHEDIGYGHIENCKGKAAAFEKAKKEAATDAMKRALRTFGNVLGNCLYDKDYLQKVQKIKVAPSRWDVENLHRHPDFAPIKRESIADVAEAHQQQQQSRGGAGEQRQESLQSGASFGSMEFEDDFGGNPFDEADFSHADEMPEIETPAKQGPQHGGAPQRQGVPRMQSMPQMRPPNVPSPAPVNNPQPPQKPQGPPRPPSGAVQPQQTRPQPPQAINNAQRGINVPPLPPQNNANGGGNRSNPSSATSTTSTSHHPNQHQAQQQQEQVPHNLAQSNATNGDLDPNGLPIPRQPPPGIPEGFVTGRNADLLNQPSAANRLPNPAAIAFNPHADSPSIRRTHGVNPGKSAPIMRSALQSTSASNVSNVPGQNAAPQAHQPGPNVPPAPPAAVSSNGLNGATTPVRTNFVNPSADMNRRIGMPPTTAGIQNRNAYRPPGANLNPNQGLKRPPLSDVSNLQAQQAQMDGSGEIKKAKVGEQAAGAEGENAVAAAEGP